MISLPLGILIYSSVVLALLIFKLIWDWYAKNKQKRIINHGFSAFMDCIIYSFSASLIFNYYLLLSNWVVLGAFIIALGFRWLFFDLLFNIINKKRWDHYGNSAKLDLFLKKTGNWHIFIKLAVILLGILIIII